MKHLVRHSIRELKAYASNTTPGKIKLDAMENTAPTPPELIEIWQQQLTQAKVNLYPDPTQSELRNAFAQSFALDEQQLLFGNGSDELIQLILLACCENEDSVMSFDPGFTMYRMSAAFCRLNFHGVDLNDDFSIPTASTIEAIKKHNPKVFFIAYPNNPTGNSFSSDDIEKIIKTIDGIVVIDEAYCNFSNDTLLHKLNNFDNVILLRTFSKIGLAGLRLGTLIAHPELVKEINKVRMPYNINTLTQRMITTWLKMPDSLTNQTKKIVEQREALAKTLEKLAIFETIYPSQANFLLTRIQKKYSSDKLHAELENKGILVKNLNGNHPLLANCLRISIGQEQENEQLLDCLHKITAETND